MCRTFVSLFLIVHEKKAEEKFVGKVAAAHTDAVTQLLYTSIGAHEYLISGSSDRSIVLYRRRREVQEEDEVLEQQLSPHGPRRDNAASLMEFLTPAERQYLESINAVPTAPKEPALPSRRTHSFFEALSSSRNANNRAARSPSRLGPRSRTMSTSAAASANTATSSSVETDSPPVVASRTSSSNISPRIATSDSNASAASSNRSSDGMAIKVAATKISGTDSARMSAVMDNLKPAPPVQSEYRRPRSQTVGSLRPRTSLGNSDMEDAPPVSISPPKAKRSLAAPDSPASAGASAPVARTPFSKLKRLFRRNSDATVPRRTSVGQVEQQPAREPPRRGLQFEMKVTNAKNAASSDAAEDDDTTSEEDKIVFPMDKNNM